MKLKIPSNILVMLSASITALAFAPTNTVAETLNTKSWPEAIAPRDVPDMSGVQLYKCHDVAHMDKSDCERDLWKSFLRTHGLNELYASHDERAYRWFWEGGGTSGFVQVTIDADGHGQLISSIARRVVSVSRKAITSFEGDLASTNFSEAVQDDHEGGLDNCQDQLLEAVVNGRYHFVRRACGVSPPIQNAARRLEELAGFKEPTLDSSDCDYWLCDIVMPHTE